jgi:CspA family cold shock protein
MGMSAATVRKWHAPDGWGVLDSEQTLGGRWAHFSHIDHEGPPGLTA